MRRRPFAMSGAGLATTGTHPGVLQWVWWDHLGSRRVKITKDKRSSSIVLFSHPAEEAARSNATAAVALTMVNRILRCESPRDIGFEPDQYLACLD